MALSQETSGMRSRTSGANIPDLRLMLTQKNKVNETEIGNCLQHPVPSDWIIGFCAAAWRGCDAPDVYDNCCRSLQLLQALLLQPGTTDDSLCNGFTFINALLVGLSYKTDCRLSVQLLADIGHGSVLAGGQWVHGVISSAVSALSSAYTSACKDSALCLLTCIACLDPDPNDSVYLDDSRRCGVALLHAMVQCAASRVHASSTRDFAVVTSLLAFQGRWGGSADAFLGLLRGGYCERATHSPLPAVSGAFLAAGHDLIEHIAAATPAGTAALRSVGSALQGGGYQPPLTAAALARPPLSTVGAALSSAGKALSTVGTALSTAVAFAAVGHESSSVVAQTPLPAAAAAAPAVPVQGRGGALLASVQTSLLGSSMLQLPRNVASSPLPLSHMARTAALLLGSWDAWLGHVAGMRCVANVSAWRGRAGEALQPHSAPPMLKLLLSICSYAVQCWDDAVACLALLVLQRMCEGLQHNHMARRSAKKLSQRHTAHAQRLARRSAEAVQAATRGGRLTVQGAMLELAQFGEASDGRSADSGQAGNVSDGNSQRTQPPREAEFAIPTCLMSCSLSASSCQVVMFARRDVVRTLTSGGSTDPAATQTGRTAIVPEVVTYRPLVGAVLATASAALGLHLHSRQLHLQVCRRACQVLHRVLYLVAHTLPRYTRADTPVASSTCPSRTQPEGDGAPSSPKATTTGPSEPTASPSSWFASTVSSWGGAVAAVAASTKSAMGMAQPPPPGADSYSEHGAAAAERTSAMLQGPRGSGLPSRAIPPLPSRSAGEAAASPPAAGEEITAELHAQYGHIMRHVDWVALLRVLLRLLGRCVQLDLWHGVAAQDTPALIRAEAKRVVQLGYLSLDMLLQIVDGPARASVFYELLRCEEDVRAAVRYWPAHDSNASPADDLPPRLSACIGNLRGVLDAMGRVPGVAALRQGAAGNFDGNLTVESVFSALLDVAPWKSLTRSDRVMDAYTPLSESAESELFDAVTNGLTTEVRASLKMRL